MDNSGGPPPGRPRFRPEVFEVASIEAARSIILTPERGTTTDGRWQDETGFLRTDVVARLGLRPQDCVIDYGCGIGRLAKALIDASGCSVVGVDASAAMRRYALEYVDSPRFTCCAPAGLDALVAGGFRADHALAVWVLQHCLRPADDIARLAAGLRDGAILYVLNNLRRAVPTDRGWLDDGIDVGRLLLDSFDPVAEYHLPESVTSADIANLTAVRVLRRRPAADGKLQAG